MAVRIGMVSLGCPKNQVDAELLLAKLQTAGYEMSADSGDCEVVIINTCGFVEAAKQEAIDEIFEYAQRKKDGTIQKVVVTGCLAQRYGEELKQEIPEIDAVVGIGANGDIVSIVTQLLASATPQHHIDHDKLALPLTGERVLTTLPHFAYLKIAEGCDHPCSFCAIPAIRGRFRSRPMEEILTEANWLASQGVKEIILVAQDTTRYGEDLYGSYRLAELLGALCEIEKLVWIRLLYCYPDKITDDLIQTIAEQPKIVNYIDVPLQHANGTILQKMNRPFSKAQSIELVTKLRSQIKNVTIRTTMIAGFPGESEEQFAELAEFVQQMKFERLGCFAYSREEGTKAALMEPQIDEDLRRRRSEIITEEQTEILLQKNQQKIGQTLTVLVDGYDHRTGYYLARSEADAPEIDGKILFRSTKEHQGGDFLTLKITHTQEYDVVGEIIP